MNVKSNLKKINPFIRYRKRYLFFVLAEYLILIISSSFYDNSIFTNSFYIMFSFFLRLNISYLFERYSIKKPKLINEIIKIFIFFIIFISIELSISSFFMLNEYNSSKIISGNLIICIFSFFSIFFYRFLTTKNNKSYKNWIFVSFKNDITNIPTLEIEELKEINFYNFQEIDNLNFLKIKGIITNNYHEKKLIYGKLKEKTNSEDIEVMTLKNWCEYYLQRIPIGIINKEKIYKIENKISSIKVRIQILFKSIMESMFAIFLLILSLPLIVISASLIYLEDKGPIFYKQQRIGYKGKVFNIYKIRSMRENAENNGPQWAKKNDKRITNIGKIIRKTRIDELPQLLCIINGSMSLIGPRPERPEFVELIGKETEYFSKRKLVKPGITGWAQVNYPYGASIRDSKIKLTYDLFYIENISILMDLLIFLKTIKLVLQAKGSVPNKSID